MGKRAEKSWKTTRKFHKAKHSYTQGMLTITKYAFIAIAIILAILALNFGRSKIILTGSQNVSLAFYRYTIAESDITAEFPSNVLARITPTSAETTLMQNTGLIMQYKIDYTAANLVDVGWTAYDSNNQPAILDDCTIYCRYYGAASTSGGVAFTGPETTKQVKMPKIKTLDGTTLILTKAGTADTTDSFVKAADYYGEAIDYQGNTSDTKTYRLFYVDFDNKYKDGEGTIYLKADWTANDVNPATHSTYVPQNTKDSEIIANMNPEWRDQIDANDDGIINANELNYINAHASAWLASPSQWTEYANGNANKTGNTMYTYTPISGNTSYEINYAIASPSVEMFIDSHNESFDLSYLYNSDIYGYMFSVNNGTNWDSNTGSNTINTGKNGMYVTEGQRYTWLCSPSPALYQQWLDYQSIYYVGGDLRRLVKNQCDTELGVSPLVSIKPTTINTVGNYVELNASNRIVKGYNTLTSALSTVTNENTIKPLKDMTETVAPALAAGKTAIIDLNDKTITLDNLTLTNNGTLNITGAGTLTGYGAHTIENRGIFTKNGTSTVSNTSTNYCTLINKGTATINDGTITANHVAISENGNVTLNITGGTVSGNYGIYDNDTGAINITTGGEVIGTNNLGIRVHTSTLTVSGENTRITGTHAITVDDGGNAIITGGTITGTTGWGVAFNSKKTLTIGDNSNAVNTTMPSITGVYGVCAMSGSTFNFYDGVIKVPTGNTTISGTVSDTPTGYSVKYGTTTENGTTYDTAYLSNNHVVTLDADGGTIPATTSWTVASGNATATKSITYGSTYGTLPTPTKTGYTFNGWKTDDNLISRNVSDWEVGAIIDANGQNSSNGNLRLRLKDYVKVASNSTYTLTTIGSVVIRYAYLYDANKNFIGVDSNTRGRNAVAFTTPSNCRYIRVVLQKQDETVEIALSELTSANIMLTGSVTTDMLIPANDIYCKANWKANTYAITYDENYLKANMVDATKVADVSNYDCNVIAPTSKENLDVDTTTGSPVCKFTMPAYSGTSSSGPYIYPGIYLTTGETYTWTMYVKTSANKTLRVGFQRNGDPIYNITTSWQKLTKTFTATSGGYNAFVWYSTDGWNAGEVLYVSGIQIEEGDGSSSITTVNKTYGTTLGTLSTPTRTGYTFQGWYTDPVGGTKITSSTSVPAADTTYYARWSYNPVITTAAGTKVELTKANIANYLGTAIDYKANSSDTNTYRLFYVDFDNKYGDGYGTIYLKADHSTINNMDLTDYIAYSSSDLTVYNKFNKLWTSTHQTLAADNEKASSYLLNPSEWTRFKDTTGKYSSTVNYAVGSPSVDLYVDSYNKAFSTDYKFRPAQKGYEYSTDGGNTYSIWADANTISAEKNGMYSVITQGAYFWWLASPSNTGYGGICLASRNDNNLTASTYDKSRGYCPVISLKPSAPITESN